MIGIYVEGLLPDTTLHLTVIASRSISAAELGRSIQETD